jgi:hypothetical protein
MSLEYKLLDAGESELLCRGIERVYGTTYPSPEFYNSAFVENAVNSGVLHCVVAMKSQHEVVGCMSTILEERGDLTADGSALMVAPEYMEIVSAEAAEMPKFVLSESGAL